MKRTKHSTDFKLQLVKEALDTGNKAAVARRYEIATNMLHRWIKEYHDGKFGDVQMEQIPEFDSKAIAEENDKLKKLLGEQALEIAILRDLIKKKKPSLAEKIEVARFLH